MTSSDDASRNDRVVSIIEASLLAVAAVLVAWSGYSSAKWTNESRLLLAAASTARIEASNTQLDATTTRNLDASTFNAWFSAYLAHDQSAMNIARRRFRPEFATAFDAWIATNPATNPHAPPGPTYMSQYRLPEVVKAARLNADADRDYAAGAKAGGHANDYVLITVYLATVLFLVGVSGHFRFRTARILLVCCGAAMLSYALILIIAAPRPPSG